jgi:hypothetical protein
MNILLIFDMQFRMVRVRIKLFWVTFTTGRNNLFKSYQIVISDRDFRWGNIHASHVGALEVFHIKNLRNAKAKG